MSDFFADDDWQKRIRDEILVPQFYQRHALDGRYVLLDSGGLATRLQKEMGVDTVFQVAGGEMVSVEEKIVRWPGYPYSTFCLETDSCTVPGRESPGWMHYSAADFLLYCFVTVNHGLDCHLIDLPKLKAWFWPLAGQFEVFGPLPTLNRTMGRKVPIVDVHANVPTWMFSLFPTAQGEVVA